MLLVGPLTGVCVADVTNISMSDNSVFSGTYDKESLFANFSVNRDLNVGTYNLTFSVINPLTVQEARSPITASMQLLADATSAPATATVQPCRTDLFSPQCPQFLERNVRQSSKFAGDLNRITISLYSTVRLVPPAVITVAGNDSPMYTCRYCCRCKAHIFPRLCIHVITCVYLYVYALDIHAS